MNTPMDDTERAVSLFLRSLGYDDNKRSDLRNTAKNVAAFFKDELLDGEGKDPHALFDSRIENSSSQSMVLLQHLETHLVCPHHLTVATGVVHVVYAPQRFIVGFGTITQLVDVLSHRLVLQEDFGQSLVDVLCNGLDASGAACLVSMSHGCLSIHQERGERKRSAKVVTTSYARSFATDTGERAIATQMLIGAASER